MEKISELNELDNDFLNFGTVLPGVILRVTDDEGRKIIDNDPNFPELKKVSTFARENPPFWSSEKYKFLEMPRSYFYYKELSSEIGGRLFHFHFFRNITFEKEFIGYLLLTLFAVNFVALFLAIMSGYFWSIKILSPLRRVTRTAREISAGNMDKRIVVEKTGDEVSELSESFNLMLDRLQQSFEQQQRFVADASHELRTPITVIRGYSEMLERYGLHDQEIFQEATTSIKNYAQNMQKLVESLLFLARADQNNLPTKKTLLNLNEVLKSAVKTFNTSRIKFFDGESCEIFGDGELLKKMFSEILENALHYSDEKSFVMIETKKTDKKISVKISDEGIGISAEDCPKIFDRFFREDKSRTQTDEKKISAGLGLCIAKEIADKHGIEIKVESELGKGTTFFVVFSDCQ